MAQLIAPRPLTETALTSTQPAMGGAGAWHLAGFSLLAASAVLAAAAWREVTVPRNTAVAWPLAARGAPPAVGAELWPLAGGLAVGSRNPALSPAVHGPDEDGAFAWTPRRAAARYHGLPFHPRPVAGHAACWRSPYLAGPSTPPYPPHAIAAGGAAHAPLTHADLAALSARLQAAVRFSHAGTLASAFKMATCAAAKVVVPVASLDACPLGRICIRADPPAAPPNMSLFTNNELGYDLCTHMPWGYALQLEHVSERDGGEVCGLPAHFASAATLVHPPQRTPTPHPHQPHPSRPCRS